MKKRWIVVVALLIGSTFAFGYVIGGSNLGFAGYPDFNEYEPNKPSAYGGTVSEWEYDDYKRDVESYVDKAKEYIENCSHDSQSIEYASREAISKANDVVEEFNSFARTVTIEQ